MGGLLLFRPRGTCLYGKNSSGLGRRVFCTDRFWDEMGWDGDHRVSGGEDGGRISVFGHIDTSDH